MRKYVVYFFCLFIVLSVPQVSFSANFAITKDEWAKLMQKADFKAADQELGEAYKEALAVLSEVDKQILRSEQRAWVTKREQDAFTKFSKGTPEYVRFLIDEAHARTFQIGKNYLGIGVKADSYYEDALPEKITITGEIMTPDKLYGSIKNYAGDDFSFAIGPPDGGRIFEVCKISDICKLTAMVKETFITSVISVEIVKAGDIPQMMDATSSVQPSVQSASPAVETIQQMAAKQPTADQETSTHAQQIDMSRLTAAELQKLAEQGSAVAQYNLGIMYITGEGVLKDYAKAFQWYQKAAEQGHVEAQFNLGNKYYNGEGVSQDYAKAFQWYQKAAEQGYAKAQFNLSIMLFDESVQRNYDKALYWAQKAAEQGGDVGNSAQEQLQYLQIIGECRAQRIRRDSFGMLTASFIVPAHGIERILVEGRQYPNPLIVPQDYYIDYVSLGELRRVPNSVEIIFKNGKRCTFEDTAF